MNVKQNWGGIGDLTGKEAGLNEQYTQYDAANTKPYIKATVEMPNCVANSACKQGQTSICCLDNKDQVLNNKTIIAGQLTSTSPLADNGFTLKLETGNDVYFYILNQTDYLDGHIITIYYNPSIHNPLNTETKITFKEPIDQILFNALRYSVEKPPFTNLRRSTG